MADKKQKRHLRGAPASKGGEYAPQDRVESDRDIAAEELSNLLSERDEAAEAASLIEEEMDSGDCTPERFDELQEEYEMIESDVEDIEKRIEALERRVGNQHGE